MRLRLHKNSPPLMPLTMMTIYLRPLLMSLKPWQHLAVPMAAPYQPIRCRPHLAPRSSVAASLVALTPASETVCARAPTWGQVHARSRTCVFGRVPTRVSAQELRQWGAPHQVPKVAAAVAVAWVLRSGQRSALVLVQTTDGARAPARARQWARQTGAVSERP